MSIEAIITGKLHGTAQRRAGTTSGRQFVIAKVRAAVGDADAVFVNVVTFSDTTGAALLALADGDSLALAGTLKPGAWTDREGTARPSVDLVAAQVMTLYGLKRRRATVQAASDDENPAARGSAEHRSEPPDDFDGGRDPWLDGSGR